MNNIDFQNGFALGLASGGVVEVEKSLPDWDDDSPIIASGYGYYDSTSWELTEKGTLRWRFNPVNTGNSGSIYYLAASFGNTTYSYLLPREFVTLAPMVKQLDIGEPINVIHLNYLTNCKRIRIARGDLYECKLEAMYSLEEIISPNTEKILLQNSKIQKYELSPSHTILPQNFAQNCFCLKEINLDNITYFGDRCFQWCFNLELDVVFNAELTYLGNVCFRASGIKTVTFQNSLDSLPTIISNAFSNCTLLQDIYCPWAEGEVAGAPWGATNATIHYNYVEGEETNAES